MGERSLRKGLPAVILLLRTISSVLPGNGRPAWAR